MALNKSSINSRAVNNPTTAATSSTGGGVVVSLSQEVRALASGIVVSVAQKIGALAAAQIAASIQQAVSLRSVSTTTAVVSIQQEVKSLGAKTIDVNQIVELVAPVNTFYSRNGYEPRMYINGEYTPADQLHGEITVIFREQEAPQMTFSIIPPTGLQDIRKYVGNNVFLDIRDSNGLTRVFTGKINTPTIDILEQKINFSCSLDITQISEALTRSYLNSIGVYSNKVFSKPETKFEELTDRVSTVPSLINVNRYGVVDVKSITTKATADKSYTDSDIYRRDIDFVLGSRQRYVNKINVKIRYSYQRLHHHERNFTLDGSGTFCDTAEKGRNILLRSTVNDAVNGSEWVLRSAISFSPIWPAGWYGCNPQNPGAVIAWNGGINHQAQLKPVLDANGNPVVNDGEAKKEVVKSITDLSQTFCTGASWTAAKRFTQNVVNDFDLTVEAPQSISQNGEKVKTRNYNVSDNFDSEGWEDYKSYNQSIPAGASATVVGSNYFIEAVFNIRDYTKAANIALNIAKNEILKSHREDTVVFTKSLTPTLSLKDTVQLTTTKVTAKASVKTYTHKIDISTGEATTSAAIVLSQSEGSATNSSLSAPGVITNLPVYNAAVVALRGYFGVDPASLSGVGGYFTDQRIPGGGFTNFGTSVRVVTPPIDSLRKESVVTTTTSYDVAIPHDAITINFDQWT